MTDIHAMAIQSARQTLAGENQLEGRVIASDVFSHIEGKFDLIISNPPFHDGVDNRLSCSERTYSTSKMAFDGRWRTSYCC